MEQHSLWVLPLLVRLLVLESQVRLQLDLGKKCYMNNKAAPFILTVFAGAPLTQTIYGFLLMQQMKGSAADPAFLFGLGIASSLAMALSAYVQGKAGAAGADALAETGKGFSQYITVVGLCETVALFALVFSMVALG